MSKPKNKSNSKTLKTLNPVVIISCIILACAIMSYIIPAGSFERVLDEGSGRMVVDPSTFQYVANNPIKPFDFFLYATKGIQGGGSIIAFLFIIGGSFGIMDATNSIKAGMATLVRKMDHHETLLVPVCMAMFALFSTLAGCNEEFLAFIPLLLTISLAMGFDSLTAVALVFCSVAAGYGAGCTNAFTVGVAQGIAGLPVFSGIGLRVVIFVVLVIINVTYVTLHARKVRKDPQSSSVYEIDQARVLDFNVEDIQEMTTANKLILGCFGLTIVALIIGVIKFDFYIDELSALFLILGIVAGIIGKLTPSEMADAFISGCKGMMVPCLMVGLCKSATLILTDANIMDTIIHSLASVLNHFPPTFTAFGMFIVQDIFNIIVPSGSGQAAITMPIMAPLADLVGVTRQTSVLAFQFGDAFTNCITPASGMTMSCLAIAGVPYSKWLKFVLPLLAVWCAVAFVFLTFATYIGYGPF